MKLVPVLQRVASSKRFQALIMGVIVANAITLGLGTYPGIEAEVGGELSALESVFLGIFVVELAIRIGAVGRRPADFFRDGWNLFDFLVIAAAFTPILSGNAALLRVVRLLRVLRLVRVLPDMRLLAHAMVRSIPPIISLAVLALLVMYVYGIVGWILFHEQAPENWGTIGTAMLNLFVIMTVESWPDLLREGMDIHPWSWLYFVSYLLLASFLLFNMVIAIVVGTMEETRALGHSIFEDDPGPEDDGYPPGVDAHISGIRDSLNELEAELDRLRGR